MMIALLLLSFMVEPEALSSHPTLQKMHAEAIRQRESAGIKDHPALDEECCQIAQRWANHMASVNSMYHGGGEQIIAAGYDTVGGAIRAWRNSGGHWAWMAGRHERCGWGFQRSANGTCYWAGVFRGGSQTYVESGGGYTRTRRFGRRR